MCPRVNLTKKKQKIFAQIIEIAQGPETYPHFLRVFEQEVSAGG